MIRGTTPTFTLTIHDPSDTLDLTQANNVYVTIRQDAFDVTKTGEESRSASPGAFYNGSYELIYCY